VKTFRLLGIVGIAGIAGVVVACSESSIVVGDDTNATPSETDPTDPANPDGTHDQQQRGDDGKPLFVDASFDAIASDADASPIKVGPPDGSIGDGASASDSAGPVACVAGGGTCVALTPGACPTGTWGDATKCSCGGGLGVGCCLP
jgi:hypothetical protein